MTGAAALGGTLNVNFTDGFTPNPGTRLQLLGYGSRTGAFSEVTGLNTINGRSWDVVTGRSAMFATLEAVFGYTIEADGTFALQFKGQAGGHYEIFSSTNLTTWTPFSTTNTASGVVSVRDPQARHRETLLPTSVGSLNHSQRAGQ